jgi:hypothetical protein
MVVSIWVENTCLLAICVASERSLCSDHHHHPNRTVLRGTAVESFPPHALAMAKGQVMTTGEDGLG